MTRVLVTGAAGQIGTELVPALRARHGADQVVASDVRPGKGAVCSAGLFELLDVTDPSALSAVVRRYGVGRIYHLASLLSATAERNPQQAWQVNMGGLYAVLEVAREHNCSVFTPSSIAAFGPGTPLDRTPQDTLLRPNTIYGVTKVAGELLCDYYWHKYRVDCRGVRYPGIISHSAPPGGGTTDYAVAVYYEAVERGRYTCYLRAGTFLPMMYMPDAIKAALELMEADSGRLKHRNAFNVTAMSLDPELIARAIRKHIPGFELAYEIDPVRQSIADSWPHSLDDFAARSEWQFRPTYDLEAMTAEMLQVLTDRHARGALYNACA